MKLTFTLENFTLQNFRLQDGLLGHNIKVSLFNCGEKLDN